MNAASIIAIAMLVSAPIFVRASQDRARAAKSAAQVCTLKVTGMTCAGCEAAVRIAARSVEGVTDVEVSYAKRSAEVTFDPSRTTADAIAKAVTKRSGFRAEPVELQKKK